MKGEKLGWKETLVIGAGIAGAAGAGAGVENARTSPELTRLKGQEASISFMVRSTDRILKEIDDLRSRYPEGIRTYEDSEGPYHDAAERLEKAARNLADLMKVDKSEK